LILQRGLSGNQRPVERQALLHKQRRRRWRQWRRWRQANRVRDHHDQITGPTCPGDSGSTGNKERERGGTWIVVTRTPAVLILVVKTKAFARADAKKPRVPSACSDQREASVGPASLFSSSRAGEAASKVLPDMGGGASVEAAPRRSFAPMCPPIALSRISTAGSSQDRFCRTSPSRPAAGSSDEEAGSSGGTGKGAEERAAAVTAAEAETGSAAGAGAIQGAGIFCPDVPPLAPSHISTLSKGRFFRTTPARLRQRHLGQPRKGQLRRHF